MLNRQRVQYRAGYYKGCSFLISVSFQFSVKYWEKVHSSKSSLIWYFRPCPLSARSDGSISHTTQQSYTFNETYIFENTIKNGVDSWVLGLSNERKIFGPISDFFTFSATFPFSLTEISAHDHPLPGLNHSK